MYYGSVSVFLMTKTAAHVFDETLHVVIKPRYTGRLSLDHLLEPAHTRVLGNMGFSGLSR
jgi:hypothetical protein